MITFRHKGDFSKTTRYLKRAKDAIRQADLEKYGQRGVDALASATPIDSGKTATSWYYEIKRSSSSVEITFNNSNFNDGVPIAIIIQYGHGTRNGGWVEGRDYINPAIRPIFDQMTKEIWEEVTKL